MRPGFYGSDRNFQNPCSFFCRQFLYITQMNHFFVERSQTIDRLAEYGSNFLCRALLLRIRSWFDYVELRWPVVAFDELIERHFVFVTTGAQAHQRCVSSDAMQPRGES